MEAQQQQASKKFESRARKHNKLSHTGERKRKRTQLKRNVSVNNQLQPIHTKTTAQFHQWDCKYIK